MPDSNYVFRVHPAIGMARVGNSEEYYLGPETMAGLPVEGNGRTTGGLPIKPGTESETITSGDLRDRNGAFKRQAARFKIYQYPHKDVETYPSGENEGTEITIGSTVEGKGTVKDIIWTAHVANKKANCFVLENPDLGPDQLIIDGYEDGKLPPLRNLIEGPDFNNAARVKKLTIDPGPRAIRGTDSDAVKFDKGTLASFWDSSASGIKELNDYPKSFPDDGFSKLFCPSGDIDTLGELQTDDKGRLLVIAAYGRACAWYRDGDKEPYPLNQNVDNDGWFDDTADGPVSAVLVFEDDSVQDVHGAWVVSTDPSYAPQTLNIVSLWDEIYDSWVRKLRLSPEIFGRKFNDSYTPYFDDQVFPIFRSTALQRWTTNLPDLAIEAHDAVGEITKEDNPADTIMTGLAFMRNPNNAPEAYVGAPFMPLSLGDQGRSFLQPTLTQYFFLTQWNDNHFSKDPGPALGPGEYLDKAVLVNCLGGRFSPGIDMTFIVRHPDIYIPNWQTSGAGPFRLHAKPLDYNTVQPSQPFLTEGYIPIHSGPTGLEPGDTSKFMANPWHTDYNSCATHETVPNPLNSTTLYWSWPAQRPVFVYASKDVRNGKLGSQLYSLRGKGTESDNPQDQGRYQNRLDFLENWTRIGVVIQGTAIDGGSYSSDYYLEVESQLDTPELPPWPTNAT
ncbi:MAG: LodA/GoxA family CTQ-dependent oxidase [Chloroflexi bacterium]|nr:LodA/GoxA family CTQ-dependent oxidase [Chloroflexota bacterium]